MARKKIVIPHEHGGWAMVSVPFLLGMLAGSPQWMHFPLFLAWLFLYLASYPLLQAVKRKSGRPYWARWSFLYGGLAALFAIPPLFAQPSLLGLAPVLAVMFAVNVWHAKRKRERALLNDLCAIFSFSAGGAIAYGLGSSVWHETSLAVTGFSFLYFTGSAFFVKTVFRERTNPRWRLASRIYHLLVLALPPLTGHPWMSLPYVYAAVRAFAGGGKNLRPWTVGMMEIAGALQFLLLSVWLIAK